MVDVLLKYKDIAEKGSKILDHLDISKESYILLTIHRESNTDVKKTAKAIFNTILKLDQTIIFPAHPRTKKVLSDLGLYQCMQEKANIKMIEPLNYLDFIMLEKNASKIMTDSGGVQKEAYLLGVPCITLRGTTELIETVEEGWNILTDNDPSRIIDAVKNFAPSKNSMNRNKLGEGNSASKIVRILLNQN
jgi:UDP-N-acetylglucosamine 2-epimerase (non-hydrolysing)